MAGHLVTASAPDFSLAHRASLVEKLNVRQQFSYDLHCGAHCRRIVSDCLQSQLEPLSGSRKQYCVDALLQDPEISLSEFQTKSGQQQVVRQKVVDLIAQRSAQETGSCDQDIPDPRVIGLGHLQEFRDSQLWLLQSLAHCLEDASD